MTDDQIWARWASPHTGAKPICNCGHSYHSHHHLDSQGEPLAERPCFYNRPPYPESNCHCKDYRAAPDDHDWPPFPVLLAVYLLCFIPVHAYKLVRWGVHSSDRLFRPKPKSGAKRE